MQTTVEFIQYRLTLEELWFLASLVGSGILIDVPPTWGGMTADEKEQSIQSCIETLSEKGWLTKEKGNQLKLDELLTILLKQCLQPKDVLLLNSNKGLTRHILHRSAQGEIVNLHAFYEGIFELTYLTDSDQALGFFHYDLLLHHEAAGELPAFAMPIEYFTRAQQLYHIGENEKGMAQLKEAELPADIFNQLHEILSDPTGAFYLTNINMEAREETIKRAVLAGEAGMWLIEFDEDEARFSATDGDGIKRMFLAENFSPLQS